MTPKLPVLIVDDEPALRLSLREILERGGYEVFEAARAKEGIERASALKPRAMLLDLGLPDLDGLTVLRKVREWARFPILVVSVQNDESTIVRALDLGADDYVTKPFSGSELLARLRSALRRADRDPGHPVLQFENILVDLPQSIVKVDGMSVRLTSTEWEVLRCLASEPGKIVTTEKILRTVWASADSANLASLRVYVGHLREKLGAGGSRFIENEPGIGYRIALRVG